MKLLLMYLKQWNRKLNLLYYDTQAYDFKHIWFYTLIHEIGFDQV